MHLKLSFLTSKKILKKSHGEVKLPETYDLKTSLPKPVRDGLMCQKIFGPVEDYQCECGILKGKRNRGSTCIMCGVEIISSYSRTRRMGHISLPFPALHPLALKWVALLLDISVTKLKDVFEGKRSLVFHESSSGKLVLDSKIGKVDVFVSDNGYETSTSSTSIGVYDIVSKLNLKEMYIIEISSKIRRKLIGTMIENKQESTVYFVENIFVSPPEHRPVICIDGMWVSNSKNELYARIIRRKLRFEHMICYQAPDLILKEEIFLIQEAVNQLFVESTTLRNTDLKSISDDLEKKKGLLRANLLGKRVDYSGRSVITVGPELKLDEVGLPVDMACELFAPFVIRYLMENEETVDSYKSALKLFRGKKPQVYHALEQVIKEYRIIINRQPTLHRAGIAACKVLLHPGKSIRLNPLICEGSNSDFDGDTMAVHTPISQQSLEECKTILNPCNNLLNPRDSQPIVTPSHEMVLGLYMATKFSSSGSNPKKFKSLGELEYLYQINEITLNEKILFLSNEEWIETCLGRLLVESLLKVRVNKPIDKEEIKKLVSKAYDILSQDELANALTKLKDLAFGWVTKSGLSLCINDFKTPSRKEELFTKAKSYDNQLTGIEEKIYEQSVRNWLNTIEILQKDFITEAGDSNPLVMMLRAGARASMTQVSQLVVAKGMLSDSNGNIMRHPIEENHREGLNTIGYFLSTSGSKKGLADKKFATPKSGYLARRLATVTRDFYIVEDDCGSKRKNRSPVYCESKKGICSKCYGIDPSTRRPVLLNTAVGIIAAQSLSEPTTQMTLRTFHTSGAVKLGESPKAIKVCQTGKVKIKKKEYLTEIIVGKDKTYLVDNDSRFFVKDRQEVLKGDILAVYVKSDLRQEDVAGKIPTLELYFEMRKPKIEAVIALKDGEVDLRSKVNFIQVYIDGELQGTVDNQPVFVASGEHVKKGRFLSYGEANLKELFKVTGDIDLLATVFVDRLHELYLEEGVIVNKIHLEMVFRGLTEIVMKPDGMYGLRSFDEGKIIPMGAIQVGYKNPSWLKSVGFGWVKQGLSNAAAMNSVSYDLPSERIMSGELLLKRE